MATKINDKYFDNIDTPNKAYWIGFIWCDGSVQSRKRKSIEYLLKMDLMYADHKHLEKLNKDMDGEYEIKRYKAVNSFKSESETARLSIYNKNIVTTLIDKYGIFSHREDISKLLSHIPDEYCFDFIRGVLDADGSFHKYNVLDKGVDRVKYTIRFGASVELLRYVENKLIEVNIINDMERKISKRHPERDGNYFQLTLSGRPNVLETLSLLYDNAETYLDRKYEKYINMKEGGSNINQE